jgi:hypothetical protein
MAHLSQHPEWAGQVIVGSRIGINKLSRYVKPIKKPPKDPAGWMLWTETFRFSSFGESQFLSLYLTVSSQARGLGSGGKGAENSPQKYRFLPSFQRYRDLAVGYLAR